MNPKDDKTYARPKIVARSSAKKSFVAGCGVKGPIEYCYSGNVRCMVGPLK